MADLEFLVTNGAYTSPLGEPATYTDGNLDETSVIVVPTQAPEISLDASAYGLRDVDVSVRVRVSEVAQPVKGDKVTIYGITYTVDDYDRLNIAEWVLYVIA